VFHWSKKIRDENLSIENKLDKNNNDLDLTDKFFKNLIELNNINRIIEKYVKNKKKIKIIKSYSSIKALYFWYSVLH
jgi:hypothetical protein